MHCPDPSGLGHDTKPVGLSFDGCVHKKESYHKVGYRVILRGALGVISLNVINEKRYDLSRLNLG